MENVIKIDLQKLLASNQLIELELGCGVRTVPARINIDRIDLPGVDIVCDLEAGLLFIPDSSVDIIYANSFFEHVYNFEGLIREIVRVLKPNGKCVLSVPHFSNPYYYSDYTHKRFFGLYSFYYFVDEKYQLSRKVPSFYVNTRIKVLSIR